MCLTDWLRRIDRALRAQPEPDSHAEHKQRHYDQCIPRLPAATRALGKDCVYLLELSRTLRASRAHFSNEVGSSFIPSIRDKRDGYPIAIGSPFIAVSNDLVG